VTGAPVIHRSAGRRFVPWKNGGGQTAEILCHPPGAGFDGFGWRVSTARVVQSGPFSRFAGVTRWLAVLEGGRLELDLPGGRLAIGPDDAPVSFSGEATCDCRHSGPPVLDLNLMTRAPFSGRMRRGGWPDDPGGGAAAAAGGAPLARLILLGVDRPAEGLARHDLVDVTRLPAAAPAATARVADVTIQIYGPAWAG
jgi:hypothetical protein